MAIYGTGENKYKKLTPKEIKNEIKDLTGWGEYEYKSNYYLFRNKLRNYEKTIESTAPQPINETLLRLVRRQGAGVALTPAQSAILSTSTAANYKYKPTEKQNQNAKAAVLQEFSGLIEKSAIANTTYNRDMLAVVGHNPDGSEILRIETITPGELRRYLARLANDLHERQKRTYDRNRAFYHYNLREVGTT